MFGNYGTTKTTKKEEPKYKIEKDFGVLSSREQRGVTYEKRLRLVNWNERGAKFDIREWWLDEDGNECCGKEAVNKHLCPSDGKPHQLCALLAPADCVDVSSETGALKQVDTNQQHHKEQDHIEINIR